MSLFALFWLTATLSVLILGLITIYFNQYIPQLISNLVKYGKLLKPKSLKHKLNESNNKFNLNESNTKFNLNELITVIEVPKSYFIHFYIFPVIYNLVILLLLFTNYFPKHEFINKLITIIIGHNINIETTINVFKSRRNQILITSLLIQYIRRLYENKYISIFSNSKINLIHYMAGLIFYISSGLALLDSLYLNQIYNENFNQLLLSIIAYFIFILASILQFMTHLNLSKLRRGRDGQIRTYSHFIPVGRQFDYISCPHYLCEIIIYSCVYVISGFNYLWAILLFWVFVNQTIAALMTHNWYRSTFGRLYPKSRKAIVPWLL